MQFDLPRRQRKSFEVITKTVLSRKLNKEQAIEVFNKMKNQFRGPKLTFEAVSKSGMIPKYILAYSWVIPAQFPYKIILFFMKSTQNREKSIKIDIFI